MDFAKLKTEEIECEFDNKPKINYMKQEPQDEVFADLSGTDFVHQDFKDVVSSGKTEFVKKEISNFFDEDDRFEEDDENFQNFEANEQGPLQYREPKEFPNYAGIKCENEDVKYGLDSIVKSEDNILMNNSTQLSEDFVDIKSEIIKEECEEIKLFKIEPENVETETTNDPTSKLQSYKSKYKIPTPKKKSGQVEVRSRNGKICKPKLEICCDHCGLKMYTYQGMLHHMKTKHNDNVQLYECYHCGQKMVNKNWLTRHIEAKHSKHTKLFKCPHCPYENKWKQTVSRHARVMHAKVPKILKCQYCDFTSAWDGTVRKHYMKRHMDIEEVAAKYSKSKTWDPKNKKIIEKEHRCEICGYTTCHRPNMRKHIMRLHVGTPAALKYKDATMFKCDLCDFETVYKESLTIHRQGKHNIEGEVLKCEHCSYRTRVKRYLTNHMKRHKSGYKSKNCFTCGYCYKNYKSKASLIKHINEHKTSKDQK